MKIMRFIIKIVLIIGMITALCYGALGLINKSEIKHEAYMKQQQRKQAKLAESLRAKDYILTKRTSLIFKVSRNKKISFAMKKGQSCKFRTIKPDSGMPLITPGETDSEGWMLLPPGKYYGKFDLPRYDRVAAYEIAWWVPPNAQYYAPSQMTVTVGFSRR